MSRRHVWFICVGVVIAGVAPSSTWGAAQDTGPLTIPVRLVNGHLVVLTDLVGLHYTNEVSFEISLEYPDMLTLHPDQYAWLELDPKAVESGTSPPIKLLIPPGIMLTIPANEVAKEMSPERVQFQNSMTKFYSVELGERKLKGTIGIDLLRKYFVALDVSAKTLVLAPPKVDGEDASSPGAGGIDAPFDYRDNRVELNVTYAGDRRGRMILGGMEFDTTVDAAAATALGKPAGDIGPVWLAAGDNDVGRIDLSQYVAFRPRRFSSPLPADDQTPLFIAGWNLLSNFRLEIDWSRRHLTLIQKKAPVYPAADFEFFRAENLGTSNALMAYLEKHPADRLSREAAALLVQWRLEKDHASDLEVMNAVAWAVRTSLPGRRTETCLAYLDTFRKIPRREDLAVAAGLEGLQHSREAFDPRVVYALHNALGEVYVQKGNINEAWKHFLSAAFMAPDDVGIALNLARVYEQQGELRRAYARYKKASSMADVPPGVTAEIKAAMNRLRSQLAPDDPLLRGETASREPSGERR
jgi:hypothetical protein